MEAELQTRSLLVSQALQELAAERPSRALPYLAEALRQEDTAALRFMFADAVRPFERQLGASVTVPGGLTNAVWSPDGATVVLAGHRGVLRVLDRDLRTVATLPSDRITMAGHITADGRLVATSSSALMIWDLAKRTLLYRWDGLVATRQFANLFHVDDRFAALTDFDGRIRAVDHVTGTLLAASEPATPMATYAALSADGAQLFVGYVDGTIERRAVAGGPAEKLAAHSATIMALVPTADGRLVSADLRGGVKITRADTLAPIATLADHAGGVYLVALDRKGDVLATGDLTGVVRLSDARTGRTLRTLYGHQRGAIRSLDFSSAGDKLATAGWDNTFRVWDVETGALDMLVESFAAAGDTPHSSGGALDARFSPDGTRLLTTSGTELKQWRVTREPLLAELAVPHQQWGAKWSPDERTYCAVGFGGGIFDATTAQRRAILDVGGTPRALDCEWSHDGKYVVVTGYDGYVVVFAADGTRVRALAGHRGIVNGSVFSPDGTRLVTAGDDGQVRIWDAATGSSLATFRQPGRVLSATWSSDGTRIATAGWDRTLRVWDVATQTVVQAIGGAATQYLYAVLSPDGETLASTGHDGEVTLWSLKSGDRLSLDGHTGPATMANWSPDGELLATSADDATTRIWDPRTGRMLAVRPHPGAIMQVWWSRDGERLFSVSHSSGVRIWDVRRERRPIEELLAFAAAHSPWRLVDGRLVRAR